MRNNFAIVREQEVKDVLHLMVDTNQALLRGMPWYALGDWGKKKFENMLFLERMEAGKRKLKISYV